MNWGNLLQFLCPHCNKKLQEHQTEVRCTACRFYMSVERFDQMVRGRRQPPTSNHLMNWHNLEYARCPACSNYLMPNAEGNLYFQKCINADCTFRISDSRMGEILQNQNT